MLVLGVVPPHTALSCLGVGASGLSVVENTVQRFPLSLSLSLPRATRSCPSLVARATEQSSSSG